MASLSHRLLDLLDLDSMASREGALRRVDPRALLLSAGGLIVAVTSHDKYAVQALLPYLAFPTFLMVAARIPPSALLRRLALVSPFAVLLGIFNPLLDTAPQLWLGPVAISGGWLSFASILLRFLLTAGTALALVAAVGFAPLCAGLGRLGVPRAFVVQLLFLHRYLFVLTAEAARMSRARALRNPERRRPSLRTFGSMMGHLLLRTTARAQRIHRAMLCRGFTGRLPTLAQPRFGGGDLLLTAGWIGLFVVLRTLEHAP
jgi:cobalt/nickel transport system permease protein